MVLSETKSAVVIKISQRYCLLTVWNSDLFSICFFRRLDFFFRATLLKFRATWLRFRATWLRARWLLGDLTVNLSKYEGGRGETKDLRGRTMAKHVRFKTLYISSPSSTKQQREITKFSKFRTETQTANYLRFYQELHNALPCYAVV